MFPRAIIGRVAVYTAALLVVIWLLRGWEGLLPADRMSVIEVRRTGQWEQRPAGPGEMFLLVRVRLQAVADELERWEPALFRLEDEAGRHYRPIDDSPLLRNSPLVGPDRPVEGLLVFRMPASARGRSLLFLPEEGDHADSADHQPEDTGPQGGP